ncbi:MAG: archaeal proteasome endopeptidase complex subunit beta [Hadesarchaea archaeon]|nr:archaeal proteasome endopeptidase complex subunit beta [Hadesarchaea archaeon]
MDEERLEYLKGTTTVGLACEDGVILATDTRATAGKLVASKRAQKVYKIADHIGVSVAGGVGDTQDLVRILKGELNYYQVSEGEPMKVHSAAKTVANVLHSNRLFPYLAVLAVAGVDESGSDLYLVSLDGSMIEEEKLSTGSGSQVAYGILESEFEEDMTTNDALPIAKKAIENAMKRDIATGNEINIAVITDDGYQELSSEEIKNISN